LADPATGPRGVRVRSLVRSAGSLAVLLALASPAALRGQDAGEVPLRLHGLIPGGARATVTDKSTATFRFILDNLNPTPREARVVVFYPERPEVQYARDVYVPAMSSITSWLTVGPAPPQRGEFGREIHMILYDRTGGASRLVLPRGEERQRSRAVLYARRQPTTVVLADMPLPLPGEPEPEPAPPDAITFAQLTRHAAGLSEAVSQVDQGPLPPTADGLDGIDILVVAGNRLAEDPAGRAVVRRWVEGGGRLWVMLDRVEPATVAAILGEDFELAVVDRVGLTTVRLTRPVAATPVIAPAEPPRDFERPVPLVRVLPSPADRVLLLANDWPAAFSRPLGRGGVLFTTLGSAAWSHPRTPLDRPSPYPKLRDFPVAGQFVGELTGELFPVRESDPLAPEAFRPLLAEEIGYSVVGGGTAALILGGFVAAIVGLGVGLRRSRRPELTGWLCPAAAAVAAALFVGLGERSRRAVAPTVGVAGVVDPVAATGEANVAGLYALYNPSSGPVEVATRNGSVLGLDVEGLDGQTRVRVQTDTDSWHWEGLSLPAGVRTGPFQTTLKSGRVAAAARFGPDGIEGRLEAGTFRGVGDALVWTAGREPLALRLGPDGSFAATAADVLPPGQYLAGAVLTDRQQRRQALYRQLLAAKSAPAGRDLLLAWADPDGVVPVHKEGVRVVGSLMLSVPLEFEPTPPDTRVTVPRGFCAYRRVQEGAQMPPTLDGHFPADQRLRFQVPPSVLPLRVERATVFARVRAPSRRVTVAGVAGGRPVPAYQADAPVDPIRVEITDPALLQLDDRGGLLVNVAVGAATPGAASDSVWAIESLAVEVVGRTAKR
jgi:hypothetical protein